MTSGLIGAALFRVPDIRGSGCSEGLALRFLFNLQSLEREDFYRCHTALRKRACADRTVANKDARLRSWLMFAGIPKRDPRLAEAQQSMPPKPRYEEELPPIYTRDEISSIMGVADPYLSLVIGLALKCGLRDQELVYLEWGDIDEGAAVVRIRGKEKYRFEVKDPEQRDVPIPADLLTELKTCRKKHQKTSLVRIVWRAESEDATEAEAPRSRGEAQLWALRRLPKTGPRMSTVDSTQIPEDLLHYPAPLRS